MHLSHLSQDGIHRLGDLFETFAALARDEVADFPALRAHQRQPWHAFLCQVGVLALIQAGTRTLPRDADDWRGLLLALSPDHPGGEPWQLVVDDWKKPALLQPPGLGDELKTAGRRVTTPDELDMLLTARNHDLKRARMAHAGDDGWLFALVSLQTQEGQMGAGNYGISRMNGGYGARVSLSLRRRQDRPGAAFARDVGRLIAWVEGGAVGAEEARGTLALTWLEPWDGVRAIPFKALHPLYVDVCRQVRLVGSPSVSAAIATNSKAARIEAKSLKGKTGDPWAPLWADGKSSWGVSAAGFGYKQMTTLLDRGKVTLPPLARAHPDDGESGLALSASAVTRGQGKTEGFHERTIPVPPAAAGLFADLDGGTDRIADVATVRREAADRAQNILRHALRAAFQGGPDPDAVRHDDDATNAKLVPHGRRLDSAIDARFFDDSFWDAVLAEYDESALDEHPRRWRAALREEARAVLNAALEGAPRTSMRKWRADARARAIFEGRMRTFVDPNAAPGKAA